MYLSVVELLCPHYDDASVSSLADSYYPVCLDAALLVPIATMSFLSCCCGRGEKYAVFTVLEEWLLRKIHLTCANVLRTAPRDVNDNSCAASAHNVAFPLLFSFFLFFAHIGTML